MFSPSLTKVRLEFTSRANFRCSDKVVLLSPVLKPSEKNVEIKLQVLKLVKKNAYNAILLP